MQTESGKVAQGTVDEVGPGAGLLLPDGPQNAATLKSKPRYVISQTL